MASLARSVWGATSSLLLRGIAPHPVVAAAPPKLNALASPFSLTRSTMKVMSAIRKRCDACRIVRRGKLMYVYCTLNPRHKARNGPKRRQK